MSQLDQIPPIPIPPRGNAVYSDPFRLIQEDFSMPAPELPKINMLGQGGASSVLPWSLRPVVAGDPPVTTYTIDNAKLVDNLLTNAGPVVGALTGIVLESDTKVWLKGEWLLGESLGWDVTTIGPVGNHITWDAGGDQETVFYLLGQVLSGSNPNLVGFDFSIGDDSYHYEQLATSRLLISSLCVNGKPADYPLPL